MWRIKVVFPHSTRLIIRLLCIQILHLLTLNVKCAAQISVLLVSSHEFCTREVFIARTVTQERVTTCITRSLHFDQYWAFTVVESVSPPMISNFHLLNSVCSLWRRYILYVICLCLRFFLPFLPLAAVKLARIYSRHIFVPESVWNRGVCEWNITMNCIEILKQESLLSAEGNFFIYIT